MVSVSVALALGSPTVTAENGSTGASDVVCWPPVPLIVGATAASVSVTVVVSLVVGVPKALLLSLSVKVVVGDAVGAPAVGVNVRASSSVVIVAAVSGQRVDAVRPAAQARPGQRSARPGPTG